jgi:hypothetical protein
MNLVAKQALTSYAQEMAEASEMRRLSALAEYYRRESGRLLAECTRLSQELEKRDEIIRAAWEEAGACPTCGGEPHTGGHKPHCLVVGSGWDAEHSCPVCERDWIDECRCKVVCTDCEYEWPVGELKELEPVEGTRHTYRCAMDGCYGHVRA